MGWGVAGAGAIGADAALDASTAGAVLSTTAAGATIAAVPAAAAAAGAATSTASILSTVGMVGSALSGVTGALGAVRSAGATSASAQYQAQVAQNNASIALGQANQATAAGAQEVETQGLKTRAEVGAIKAAQAASNVDVNTGSAVDVRSSAAELGELDALTIRSNAEKQAFGYETAAAGFTGQAALASSQASQAPIAGAISATGSLLSGATGVGNQYLAWQRAAGSVAPAANFGTSTTTSPLG